MELCEYPKPKRVRNFEIEAISIPIVYNKYGDHDPDGLLYVLKEDADKVREDAMRQFQQEIPQPSALVKPLVLRVNLRAVSVVFEIREKLMRISKEK